jgi:4-carboxymuconolactone decarboxylase
MKTHRKTLVFLASVVIFLFSYTNLVAQKVSTRNGGLNAQEKSIITISSLSAKGDLSNLKTALHDGLNAGLSVSEIKEALVHLYAYCGFPRSIRALQTFSTVLDDRKVNGTIDRVGKDATPIHSTNNKYNRGKSILEDLTKTPPPVQLQGYAAFAPIIDTFLKEHLFADIFERDILTFTQRELVTIAVIGTIGNAEPMLRSHLLICRNLGLTSQQLKEFVSILSKTAGSNNAKMAQYIIDEISKNGS